MNKLKFVHIGDVHIGKERLNGELPSSDFAKAFGEAVDVTIRERADFMLIAGDFFDRARIEPNHLSEAEPLLQRLSDNHFLLLSSRETTMSSRRTNSDRHGSPISTRPAS